jgi:hypothetical protein
MYWFVLKAMMSSIIGSSFYQWWQGTRMGIWFQKHVDAFMQHIATKYDIDVAKKDAKFQKQFPLIAERLKLLENDSHPPVAPKGATELIDRINAISARLDEVEKSKCGCTKKSSKKKK